MRSARRVGGARPGHARNATAKSSRLSALRTVPSQGAGWGCSAGAGRRAQGRGTLSVTRAAELEAILFDCDGVILESEDLHREAYNMAFTKFGLQIDGEQVEWSEAFYDILQNTVGGGKPKMRWYFRQHLGKWPSQQGGEIPPPETEEAEESLVDELQDYKSAAYRDLVANVAITRPGVLRLMDEARKAGIYVAVCSAATKASVVFTLNNLLGTEAFEQLDCFLGGSDVSKLKPDPEIYLTAAKKLNVDASKCVVIEDSIVGLKAALGAEMDCVITYTKSTANEAFEGAKLIVSDMGEDSNPKVTLKELLKIKTEGGVVDDRVFNT